MSCRNIFIALVLVLCLHQNVFAAFPLEVTVEGVEPPLYDNILAQLKIYIHRNSDRLSEANLSILHKEAGEDIRAALAPYGYYAPDIISHLEQKEGRWFAKYTVNKGRPVLVRKINISGVGTGAENPRLAALIEQEPFVAGDILRQDVYQEYKQKLVRIAFEEGYLDATLGHHRLEINRGQFFADVTLVLELGPLYKFGELESAQNIIDNDLLSRYRPYKTGDPYRSAQLFEYQKNLYRSGFFEQVVVSGDIPRAEDEAVPVTVELTPLEKLNKYTLGIGVATDTGARATIGWSNKLLNTKGHKFSTAMEVGQKESSIQANYELPYNDPRYEKIVLTGLYQDQNWDDTDTTLLSAGPSYVYSTPHIKYSFGLDFRDENYTVGSVDKHSNLVVPTITASYIVADNLIKTKNGIQLSSSVRGASEQLLGDESFLQLTMAGKIVITPLEKWRVIGRGLVGATLMNEIDYLPPTLRFYAGGDKSVRGYGYRSIGTTDSDGTVIGGLYTLVGSVELERSFTEYIAGAVFWDAGNATETIEYEYSQGVGVGARLNLPFGQVRFDVATAITESGFPIRFHLSMGGEF